MNADRFIAPLLGALFLIGCGDAPDKPEAVQMGPVEAEPVSVALVLDAVIYDGADFALPLRLFSSEPTQVGLFLSWSRDGEVFTPFAESASVEPVEASGQGISHLLVVSDEGVPEGQLFIKARPLIDGNVGDTLPVFVQRRVRNLDLVEERFAEVTEEINDAFATIGVGLDKLAQPKRVNGALGSVPDVGTMSPVFERLQDPLGGPADLQARARAGLTGCGGLSQNVSEVARWRLGEAFEAPPRGTDPLSKTPLLDALDIVYAGAGQAVPDREALALTTLDWPLPLRRSLGELFAAVALAAAQVELGNAGVDRDAEADAVSAILSELGPGFTRFGRLIDRHIEDPPESLHRHHLEAAWTMANAIDRARWGLTQAPASLQGALMDLEVPGVGRVLVAGSSDDSHDLEAALLVDLGGADVYSGKVASTFAAGALSFVVDVSGDDVYGDESASWSCGAAFYGVAGVADFSGDDAYRSAHFGQGMGYSGVGILYDASGHDEYIGETHLQGVGILGSGLLIDGQGDDLREVTFGGQGVGARQGVGWLLDGQGEDLYTVAHRDYTINTTYRDKWAEAGYPGHGYIAFSQGVGVGFFAGLVSDTAHGGGIGVIIDGSGNDEYVGADEFGLGVGYYWGLGAVVEVAGDDSYRGWDYTIGSAQHVGVAFLLDMEGNDSYGLSVDHAQGHGLDNSTAMLIDFGGDDEYLAVQESQGTGVQVAGVGIMVDLSGADRYGNSLESNQGWSREQPSGTQPSSCFLDLGGEEDSYSRVGAENGATWHNAEMTSVGRDLP